jgi:hypothetical protein
MWLLDNMASGMESLAAADAVSRFSMYQTLRMTQFGGFSRKLPAGNITNGTFFSWFSRDNTGGKVYLAFKWQNPARR